MSNFRARCRAVFAAVRAAFTGFDFGVTLALPCCLAPYARATMGLAPHIAKPIGTPPVARAWPLPHAGHMDYG